ncbi:extracellular solute-binding protein [Arcanobacterium haemolyticum]|nr:extracellular solute-binding protein [Arcanobacterium haemolyticum]
MRLFRRPLRRSTRRAIRPLALLVVVAVASVATLVAFFPHSPDLSVLCSNNKESCDAVASAYEHETGRRVNVLRISTSVALTRLEAAADSGEFDIWMGGPSDAYALADSKHLLRPVARAQDLSDDEVPAWRGLYGGILAFCIADSYDDVTTWDELARSTARIVQPNPLSSGTAISSLALHSQRLQSHDDLLNFLHAVDHRTVTYSDSGIAPASLVTAGRADIAITFAQHCDKAQNEGQSVHTVIPRDGTTYEIGGIAVLRGSRHTQAAVDFLEFASSDAGQSLGAYATAQIPVSPSLPGNLDERLTALDTPVFSMTPYALAAIRPELITMWRQEVRHGEF